MNHRLKVDRLKENYYKKAMVRTAFQAVTLHESLLAGKEDRRTEAEEEILIIKEGILCLLGEKANFENTEKRLEDTRNAIIQKMQVLTMYVDMLQIYEYVLNRMELRYQEEKQEIDEQVFAEKLLSFIFSGGDNAVINETIRDVIGQLPVRMAKGRYYDLVKDSLKLYQGGDRSSVENYLYRFRTCAMLYRPKGAGSCFTEYEELLDTLRQADYRHMEEPLYTVLVQRVEEVAASLVERTELYMTIQELLNSVYAAILVKKGAFHPEWKEEEHWREIIKRVMEVFGKKTGKNITEELTDSLSRLEGVQEAAEERLLSLDRTGFEEDILLQKLDILLSASIFVDFSEEENILPADADYIREETQKLLSELSALFEQNKTCVNRAIMAGTLNLMPVFFQNASEVGEYIHTVLGQCRDYSEKTVSMQILSDMMENND